MNSTFHEERIHWQHDVIALDSERSYTHCKPLQQIPFNLVTRFVFLALSILVLEFPFKKLIITLQLVLQILMNYERLVHIKLYYGKANNIVTPCLIS